MKLDKHIIALREVIDEINSALEDEEGLIRHQRRLALMISLGMAELIEIYFHKLHIMKEGSRIKHDWLKKKDIKEILSNQITSSIDSVEEINELLKICKKVEDRRNDIAYSSPLDEEDLLKEEINDFFKLKELIEKIVGVVEL
ncbi:MAG: hypothetical protein AABX39_02395 [Nanoarchaeota archaeon]|mgnify:CR=1 FL=1